MIFEWDENKNEINRKRHGIGFLAAVTVFDDLHHVSRLDHSVHHEERWQTIGTSEGLLLLFVVHTYKEAEETIVRIISARKADKRERRQYENGTF